jgi:hypothetical protein
MPGANNACVRSIDVIVDRGRVRPSDPESKGRDFLMVLRDRTEPQDAT